MRCFLALGCQPLRSACVALGLLTLLCVNHVVAITVPDTLAQRVAACTACHGKEGRSTATGFYPRIAGKPAGYLYNQLVNFQSGRRTNGQMQGVLRNLSDDYLREIAGYFAGLELPYPAPQTVVISPQQLQRGRALVTDGDPGRGMPACAACHGRALTGVAPAVPGLLGLPRDYLNSQLGAWRSGQRHAATPDCMATVALQLSPPDISAVTAWLAVQPVPHLGRPATAFELPPPARCGAMGP
jgi:cytochrome c553